MKAKILSYLISLILLFSITTSCDLVKNGGGGEEINNFLLSYDKVNEYFPALIEAVLQSISTTYPEVEPILAKVEHEVEVYKIEYATKFRGDDIIASGLVCVPATEGKYPLLSYQTGTNTLHNNAPTTNPDNDLFRMIQFMASTGFIITIPDYLGFGSSDNMFHPYLDKESTVRTILDMQKAAKELAKNHLNVEVDPDFYITGYSLGGWATMQIQKTLEENFTSELNLKASACSAGPYDLNVVNDHIMGLQEYPMPYFLGYLYNSYFNLGYITNPVTEIFQEPYASKISTLYDGTNSGNEINSELTVVVPDLFTSDFINNYKTDVKYSTIAASLTANSVEAWKVSTPTMLLHGSEDTFVPPSATNRIFQEFLMEGVGVNDVVKISINGANHQTAVIPAGIAAISWFLEIKDEAGM